MPFPLNFQTSENFVAVVLLLSTTDYHILSLFYSSIAADSPTTRIGSRRRGAWAIRESSPTLAATPPQTASAQIAVNQPISIEQYVVTIFITLKSQYDPLILHQSHEQTTGKTFTTSCPLTPFPVPSPHQMTNGGIWSTKVHIKLRTNAMISVLFDRVVTGWL